MMFKILVLILCVRVHSVSCARNEIPQSNYDDTRIIFPGEDMEYIRSEIKSSKHTYIPTVPKECVGQSYCQVKDENYPQHKMEELINNYNLSIFSVVEVIPEEPQLLEGRIGFGHHGKVISVDNMCREKITTLEIFQARNVDNEYKYIVQGERFQQILVMRHCESPEGRCSNVAKFSSNVISKCTQFTAQRSLMSLTHNGSLESDIFHIPCCCICKWQYKEENYSSS